MKGAHVLYNNRMVPVEGFRTFVYGPLGAVKLVESWAEYQSAIASGVWFISKDKVKESELEKPKDSNKKGGK